MLSGSQVLLSVLVLVGTADAQSGYFPQGATPSMWKEFSIDKKPDGITRDKPLMLMVRTEFPGTVRFVDNDEFKVVISASTSANLTRTLRDVVEYSLVTINATDTEQAVVLQVLESPEISPVSTLMKKIGISVGLMTAVVLLLVILAVFLYYRKRRKDKAAANTQDNDQLLDDDEDTVVDRFGVNLDNVQGPSVSHATDDNIPSWAAAIREKQATGSAQKKAKKTRTPREDTNVRPLIKNERNRDDQSVTTHIGSGAGQDKSNENAENDHAKENKRKEGETEKLKKKKVPTATLR